MVLLEGVSVGVCAFGLDLQLWPGGEGEANREHYSALGFVFVVCCFILRGNEG